MKVTTKKIQSDCNKPGLDFKDSIVGKTVKMDFCSVPQLQPCKLRHTHTHTDWEKSLILHALDAVHTPPSSSSHHTGKFSMPPRLRQKMRLLYLNDYGNGEHAAGPL